MNRTTLSQGEPWMTPEERDFNNHFIQSTTQRLAARGVPETPFLMLRINDVIVTWLLARRLESALAPKPGEPAPCPTPAQAGAIGKCRDRLCRAMKDLEACCPRDTAPAEQDLVEPMHHVAQQLSEPALPNDYSNPNETQTIKNTDTASPNETQPTETKPTETASPEPLHNPTPAETNPTPEPTTGQPDTHSTIPTPISAQATPTESPPPMNRTARRSQAREERRNRRGIPIRRKSS